MLNLLHSLVFLRKNRLSRSDLTVSGDNPLVRHEFCECHWTASMHFLRGNAYFRTKAKLCSVCEGRRSIGIYASGINFSGETLLCTFAGGYYGFTVSGAEIVYMCNGFVKTVNGFDSHGIAQELCAEIRCTCKGQKCVRIVSFECGVCSLICMNCNI